MFRSRKEHAVSYSRVCLVILDGVGAGPAPDSHLYNDAGADTIGHLWERCGGLHLPNLLSLGLGAAHPLLPTPTAEPKAAFGLMREASVGKDTTIGHWELAGLISDTPFPVFPNGFPRSFLDDFERQTGRRTIGNVSASGTAIIEQLGDEHQRSGSFIVYTSADSVFQIAAHEETVPIEELYQACLLARTLLTQDLAVARVIARPFLGTPGKYYRTDRRKDFSLPPPRSTILDRIRAAGQEVVGIGKIEDIFAGQGITKSIHTHGNDDGVNVTLAELARPFPGLLFVNLVDYDMKYGHRRDVDGFKMALETFDYQLSTLLNSLTPTDTLIITADHGNDPTHHGTDHTRELVPLLAIGRGIQAGQSLGIRNTFADVGATISELLAVEIPPVGTSFAKLAEISSIEETSQ